jgi:hypothetical protein
LERNRLPEATIQATFNLSPELYDRLKDQARAETRSMRQIVEDALNSYLSKPQPASVVRSEGDQDEAPQKAKS